ncbi:MAG: FAD:protein FMN transferase, partial [Gammaproteobacteria bacterium]|nr:FAD:protein FMN transferase [Gammaproteobacteria bacterium]
MTHLLQRRQCLAGLGGLLVAGLGMRPALASPTVHRTSRVLMGTRVDIVAQGDNPGATATAVQAAFAEMQRLERMMSRYRADSLVSAMHRSAGRGRGAAPAAGGAV